MLDPLAAAILVRAGDEGGVGVPFGGGGHPHGLWFGADDLDGAVPFELAAVAAVDQAPIVPRLGDQGDEIRHAARAAGMPMVARALGPMTMRAPYARS